jgi:50S ribosomal subunit-associated GTPase HflX
MDFTGLVRMIDRILRNRKINKKTRMKQKKADIIHAVNLSGRTLCGKGVVWNTVVGVPKKATCTTCRIVIKKNS